MIKKLKVIDKPLFEDSFPNKQNCYKLLAERKWQDGFHCKHCESNKYIKEIQQVSRKCSKCGYDESTTTKIWYIIDKLNQTFRSELIIQ